MCVSASGFTREDSTRWSSSDSMSVTTYLKLWNNCQWFRFPKFIFRILMTAFVLSFEVVVNFYIKILGEIRGIFSRLNSIHFFIRILFPYCQYVYFLKSIKAKNWKGRENIKFWLNQRKIFLGAWTRGEVKKIFFENWKCKALDVGKGTENETFLCCFFCVIGISVMEIVEILWKKNKE